MAQKLAVAVFVKTPGLSPLKTRLAKTIGEEAALNFYELSCRSIAETLQSPALKEIVIPYWAVAEGREQPFWNSIAPFSIISQGEGSLGERLHYVYHNLLERHGAVALIGADAPQLDPAILCEASRLLRQKAANYVTGPAADGGFYLFASQQIIEESVWTKVTYSSSQTLAELLANLPQSDRTTALKMLHDVDEFTDLRELLREFSESNLEAKAKRDLNGFVQKLLYSYE